MFKIVQKRNWLFALSLALLVPGVIAFAMWGLRLGLDFTGGSLIELSIPTRPATEELRDKIAAADFGDGIVQSTGEGTYSVRLPFLSNDQHTTLLTTLNRDFPGTSEIAYETVGPTIGNELRQRAVIAVIAVLAGIILFITYAFRRVSRGPVPSWIYGTSALVALVHDVFMVIGIFAILGHYFGIEVDALFVTALLTVLGFSIHDTIVVFDRIRERLRVSASHDFETIVNESLNQTLVRSLNTSLTTVIVLIALALFGGDSIRHFILALIFGIVSGTYSSIFVAAPLLVVYDRWRNRRNS
ncbi:MAG: protein translocase subunit SecF [Candidatus Kerfeldbacteria bacterium]|nr:protein translocase subunit SecF [Candidatus Kerfeldbacteria bacterium]